MSIRITKKDRLPEHAKVEVVLANVGVIDQTTHVLREANATLEEDFLVIAVSGKAIDFSTLAAGCSGTKRKGNTSFTGRRELTLELLPAIRDLASSEEDTTVRQKLSDFRIAWRTFDEIEARTPTASRLKSVSELSDVHGIAMLDRGMTAAAFSKVIRCFNLTLLALGEKQLYWEKPRPGGRGKVKHLNSLAEVKRVKDALKRLWFGWCAKYELAQRLLLLTETEVHTLSKNEKFILISLRRFADARKVHKTALPTPEQLNPEGVGARPGVFMGYPELTSYFFPDSTAIKAGFHLCMATSGWNPAVLLNLKFDEEIFMPHPNDDNRYIMRGIKLRAGGAEQRCSGLKKTRHGPYSIINFLIEVSKPLREQLRAKIELIERKLDPSTDPELTKQAILVLQQEKVDLAKAAQSVFLYPTRVVTGRNSGFNGIQHLNDHNFADTANGTFIGDVIKYLNQRNPETPIGNMTATDFRDAYALHWFKFSGGDILTVMRKLNHRNVSTTVTYTNNVIVRVRNQNKARTVLKAWWGEVEEYGGADPTLVSFTVRHGQPSAEQRERLKTYRTMMLTQLGTRCNAPHSPPTHVAPHFKPDGQKVCEVHRCMLCVTNAIITPESLDGIARRFAELAHIRSSMSIASWESATAYVEEMDNTELALAGFEASAVQDSVERWSLKIEHGEHQVMPFESI